MAVDSVACQKKITVLGIIFASLFSVIALIIGDTMAVFGILFGAVLNAVNYWVVAAIFRAAFGARLLVLSKGMLFAFYQVRFLIMIIILFAVLLNTNASFGFGTFLGFLAMKIGLGIVVVSRLSTD